MGFLDEGETLDWSEVSKVIDYIKRHGVAQLVHLYNNVVGRSRDQLLWGDEVVSHGASPVEYMLIRVDDETQQVTLDLRGAQVLEQLQAAQHAGAKDLPSLWHPEYGAFMLEGTPGGPYGRTVEAFLQVEGNMRRRRAEVESIIASDQHVVCFTHFPLMGVGHFTTPAHEPDPEGSVSRSLFLPDELINPHQRFSTLTRNIRLRRGRKVAINVPMFLDRNTVCPAPLSDQALPGHIYMDAMGFGMGSSCLQCTYQCCNIAEARAFYDALVPLAPVMLALTANCPAFRGMLADTDCRWNVICAAVDSRREEELPPHLRTGASTSTSSTADADAADAEEKHGSSAEFPKSPKMGYNVGNSGGSYHGVVPKSRYAGVSLYIGENIPEGMNDIEAPHEDWVLSELLGAGMDESLARHFAHLFIQDPMVVYKGKVKMDDQAHTDHFENIQSTNWQSVRFKPPPPASSIGWRVEFRTMELQFCDFENAAFAIFIALITRVFSQFNLDLYTPISKVDINMERAQVRDAVLNQVFYWGVAEELSINEIINGPASDPAEGTFPGFLPLIHAYLETVVTPPEVMAKLEPYFELISKRASGELPTGARWQRDFITSHPDYHQDSIVSSKIVYDLTKKILSIQDTQNCKDLLGCNCTQHLSK